MLKDDDDDDGDDDDDDDDVEAGAPNSTFFAQNLGVSLSFLLHFCHTLIFSVPFSIVLAW